jgi:hypothetical protein
MLKPIDDLTLRAALPVWAALNARDAIVEPLHTLGELPQEAES